MDKRKLLDILAEQIASDLAVLSQAAQAAYEAATHAESKAEDQYDTRGLEASYLAATQAKRTAELKDQLDLYRFVDIKDFDKKTPIASTAVVELESEGKRTLYLLMPTGGGRHTTFENRVIQVVTPQSPIGEALLGKKVEDQIEIEIGKTRKDFDITGAW